MEIETQSMLFDLELVEEKDLDSDLVALRGTNHAGETIYMICQRETLRELLSKI
jgi:hypothetical protein